MEKLMMQFALIKLAAFILVVGVTGVVSAQEADARPDREIVAEQYLLVGTATRGCGESQVAVNPLNPDQIAASGIASIRPAPNSAGVFRSETRLACADMPGNKLHGTPNSAIE